ncbi:MAG: MMPL family transporter [Planctomycetes bacterium]|nr:MMPL family transporter [Planctomycetota bacterium]
MSQSNRLSNLKPLHHNYLPKGIALAIVICALVGGFRIKVNTDVLQSLPHFSREVELLKKASRSFDTFRTLFVTVECLDRDNGARITRELTQNLKDSGLFAKVINGFELNQFSTFQDTILENRSLYIGEDKWEAFCHRLSLEGMQKNLLEARRRLQMPGAVLESQRFKKDPLNILEFCAEELKACRPPGPDLDQYGLFSSGNQHLILLKGKGAAMDSAQARVITRTVKELAERYNHENNNIQEAVRVEYGGAYRAVAENAEAIQSSVERAVILGGIALFFIFIPLLRSSLSLLLVFMPAVIGCLAATGLSILFWSEIQVLALAFAGVLIGITTDYSLHTYTFIIQHGKSWSKAFPRLLRPVLLSSITTALAFCTLYGSDFECLRQAGFIGSMGILFSIILTLTILPPALSLLPNNSNVSARLEYIYKKIPFLALNHKASGGPALTILLITILCMGVGLIKLRFEGDMSQLDAKSPEATLFEQELQSRWKMGDKTSLLLNPASSQNDALDAQARLFNTLWSSGSEGLKKSLFSTAPLLLGPNWQAMRWKRWKEEVHGQEQAIRANFQLACKKAKLKHDKFKNYIDAFFYPKSELLEANNQSPLFTELLQASIALCEDGSYMALSTLNSEKHIHEARSLLPKGESFLVNRSELASAMAQGIKSEFLKLGIISLLLIVGIVTLSCRNIRLSLASLTPVAMGLFVLLGGMGWLNIDADLMSIFIVILVLGTGVDYGIFIAYHASSSPSSTNHAELKEKSVGTLTVLVCATTTISSMMAIGLAGHPVFIKLGLGGAIGLLAVILSALYISPRLLTNTKKSIHKVIVE